MIYTVGSERSYDNGIELLGKDFKKLGRTKDYSGGYACRTPEDAKQLITDMNKEGEWAVYEVDADWEQDTVPSVHGWWHALLYSSTILRKVVV